MIILIERELKNNLKITEGNKILFKTKEVQGPPLPYTGVPREAKVTEISPSMNYVKLDTSWYSIHDITVLEVLNKPKKEGILSKMFW